MPDVVVVEDVMTFGPTTIRPSEPLRPLVERMVCRSLARSGSAWSSPLILGSMAAFVVLTAATATATGPGS